MSKRVLVKEFTEEQKRTQLERGTFFRDSLFAATRRMTDGVDDDDIAICLSGGADSTTVLWSLLDCGKRPHVLTFSCPNTKPHADMLKALHLAKHYGLESTVVELPDDPNYVAQSIEMLHEYDEGELKSRPDHEVLFVFYELVREAVDLGKTYVFTGLGDMNITLAGRKEEMIGRDGEIGRVKADFMRTHRLSPSGQEVVMTKVALELGAYWCCPNFAGPMNLPYFGLDWDEMNRDMTTGKIRMKEITLRPYRADIETSKLNVIVKALQAGDTGLREYFDNQIVKSSYANKRVGKRVSSAQVFYNWLNRQTSLRAEEGGEPDPYEIEPTIPEWSLVGYVGDGTPLLGGLSIEDHDFANPETGRIWPDVIELITNGEDDGELSVFDLPEDGESDEDEPFDDRVDCLGHVFGEHTGRNDCPRAQAGLCGFPASADVPPLRPEKCSYIPRWLETSRSKLESLAHSTDGNVRAAYLDMIENSKFFESKLVAGQPTYDFANAPRH